MHSEFTRLQRLAQERSRELNEVLGVLPSQNDIESFLGQCILSASGWRAVFAESGLEEDQNYRVSAAALVVVAAMGKVFADNLPVLSHANQAQWRICLACDTRPTGDWLGAVLIRSFLVCSVGIDLVFMAAAPEAMAHAKLDSQLDGFAYISASHNPIGHNGLKFGLKTGGVLNGAQVNPLISQLKSLLANRGAIEELWNGIRAVPQASVDAIYQAALLNKEKSLKHYVQFCDTVNSPSPEFTRSLAQKPIGILADFNGSARSVSIDRDYLENLGVEFQAINDQPRQIAHRIVPEGQSLHQCRDALTALHQTNPNFNLAYVPDCDGDRGNIVYFNQNTGQAEIIEAQTLFALCVLAELCDLKASGQTMAKVAVAVNDPTSMRIDAMATMFGCSVYRAEVGEANVVNLAETLREQGLVVRILGEGSNGGNITHPAAVRDPLNSIGGLLKLLVLRGNAQQPGLFQTWCQISGCAYQADFSLSQVIASLPAFTTTSAYEDRAILKIKTLDHGQLKAKYESIFLEEWNLKKAELSQKFGISQWVELNNEGIREQRGFGPQFRSGAQRGGFKILFSDKSGKAIAYLWMRGSGTEPVFRVSVDLQGNNPEGEAWLLQWHVNMIQRADSSA